MSERYRPVSCTLYASLELAVLRKLTLSTVWDDEAGCVHLSSLHLQDLTTRAHEEFLIALDAQGMEHRIRLDRLRRLNGQPPLEFDPGRARH